MGVLMFRFWAGTTAALLIGLLGVSRVFSEEFGRSVTPFAGSQSTPAYSFGDANLSSRSGAASLWGSSAGIGLSKSAEPVVGARAPAFVDFPPASSFGVEWSPMDFVASATAKGAPRLTASPTSVDTYFDMFESLSKQRLNSSRAGASFVSPVGGMNSTRPMR